MKAVGLRHYLPITNEESLIDVESDRPVPRGRDLLVSVRAIAVNPVDTKVRAPKDGEENPPRVLGWDAAGVVEAVGPDAILFRPGDAVYYAGSITRAGANSEYHIVDERIVGRKPKALDFPEAAAMPLTTITAWEGLFDRLGIPSDGSAKGAPILIIGGAGGVGSIAIQLASRIAGLDVIATASRDESKAWCMELGASAVINHRGDMAAQLKDLGHEHVPYIFCLNDTDRHWPAMAEMIAPQGHVCSIVETASPVDLGLFKSKSATFAWEFMFTRAMYGTADMEEQHRLLNRVADAIDDGAIRTTVGEVLRPINAANLRAAHAQLESGRTIGKIVLEGWN